MMKLKMWEYEVVKWIEGREKGKKKDENGM